MFPSICRLDLFGRYSDIEQDNMIQLNTAAILDMTGCPREDIIFISFHNKVKDHSIQ